MTPEDKTVFIEVEESFKKKPDNKNPDFHYLKGLVALSNDDISTAKNNFQMS